MTNKLIGDSYKKIRYADFIYMLRMREDKNFLSEGIREQVIAKKQTTGGIVPDAVSPEILSIKDRLYDVLVPMEVKITKSKDSEKNKSRFFLFCKENLRIYNTIDEYIKDAPMIKILSDKLDKDVNNMINHTISQIVTTDFIEPDQESDSSFVSIDNFEDNGIFQPEPTDGIFH